MTTGRVLLDSAVVIYAIGRDHPVRAACRRVIELAASNELDTYVSTEMVQEVVHHRLRKTGNHFLAVADGRDLLEICSLLPFDRQVLELSLDLVERTSIRGRDAVHAATAIAYGIDRIVSPDLAFDDVPGVVRVDPGDF